MKTCPRCATVAADTTLKCGACGALLVAPPARPAPLAAATGVADTSGGGDEHFFAPAVLHPVAVSAPAAPARRRIPASAFVAAACVVLVLVVAVHALTGASPAHAKAPVILPPHAPSNGLPGSLADVVRVQAESGRQLALAALVQSQSQDGTLPATVSPLGQYDPSLRWVDGATSSTDPHEVSYAVAPSGATIAISASSKEVCAFARWAPGTVAQYVTVSNVSSCRAVDAPDTGWSELAGGSSSDLPHDGW